MSSTPGVVRWNSDKRYLLDFERAGVAIVPTVLATRDGPVDLGILCAERGWQDVVVKPSSVPAPKARSAFRWRIAGGGKRTWRRCSPVVTPWFSRFNRRSGTSRTLAGLPRRVFAHAFTKPPFLRGTGGGLGEAIHDASPAERPSPSGPWRGARCDDLRPRRPGAHADGPRLMELELIEPDLGLRLHRPSIAALVAAILGLSATEALAAAGARGTMRQRASHSITGSNAGP